MNEKNKEELSKKLGIKVDDLDLGLEELIDRKKILVYHNKINPSLYGSATAVIVSSIMADHIFNQPEVIAEVSKMEIQYEPNFKRQIQTYVSTFRKRFSEFLEDGIGQEISIVGFSTGVLIDIRQDPEISSADIFMQKTQNLTEAFNQIGKEINHFLNDDQNAKLQAKFQNEVSNESTEIFIGTGISLVKGNAEQLWTKVAAEKDVKSVINAIKAIKAIKV